MNTLPKTLESKVRIQYHDCDPFNHLNNSRFIDYMVGARTEQLLEHYDFNTAELVQKQGIGWVAVQTQISYLFPAVWMEKVTIESRLFLFSESSLMVEILMWDENKTHIKAILWTKLVHFNLNSQRSMKHSQELMDFFNLVHYSLGENPVFEDRVKSLRELNLPA